MECPYEKPFSNSSIGKVSYVFTSAFSGSISIIGSSLVIYIIFRGGRAKLSRLRNRLLLVISVVDIFSSVALGLSIIPTPQETACSIGMGNLSTCAVQGFFIQFSAAAPAYNAVLALYFVLAIRYGMDQATIAKKYELLMHAFALIPSLTAAIIGVTNKMYFSESSVCWIGDICQSNGNCPDGNVWGKGYGLAISTVCYTTICGITTVSCMIVISWTLRRRNLVMMKYSFTQKGNSRSKTRKLNEIEFATVESAKQAYLYFAAFIVTYIWGLCGMIGSYTTGKPIALPMVLHFHVAAIFVPLQGMWNFLAYVRPIVSKIRRDKNDDNISFITALKFILSGADATFNKNNHPVIKGVENYHSRRFSPPNENLPTAVEDSFSESLSLSIEDLPTSMKLITEDSPAAVDCISEDSFSQSLSLSIEDPPTPIDLIAENNFSASLSLSVVSSPTATDPITKNRYVQDFSLPSIIPSDTNEDPTNINHSIRNKLSRRLSLPIEYPWHEEGLQTNITKEGLKKNEDPTNINNSIRTKLSRRLSLPIKYPWP